MSSRVVGKCCRVRVVLCEGETAARHFDSFGEFQRRVHVGCRVPAFLFKSNRISPPERFRTALSGTITPLSMSLIELALYCIVFCSTHRHTLLCKTVEQHKPLTSSRFLMLSLSYLKEISQVTEKAARL